MLTALLGVLDNLWFGGNLSGWYYPLLVFTDLAVISRLGSMLPNRKESTEESAE